MAQSSSSEKHFICQFYGCDHRCDGNHSDPCDSRSDRPSHAEFAIYDLRTQCKKCVYPCDNRVVRYSCRKCWHVYCYACCFKVFDPVEAQTKWLALSIPPSTKYTIVNTDGEERFEEIHTSYGEQVQLLDNGRTIMSVKVGFFACALGIRSYSSGIHRIQIRIDNDYIVMGIRSRNIPLIPDEIAGGCYSVTPSTYGWGKQYTRFINGKFYRQSWPEINRGGHVYTIVLNCDEHQLKIINENTKEQDEIEVDVRHAPFPWRFFVELSHIITNRVSLISTP